jgi:hypothetical protein
VSAELCKEIEEDIQLFVERQEGRFICFGNRFYSNPIKFETPLVLNEEDFEPGTQFDASKTFNVEERRKSPTMVPHKGSNYRIRYLHFVYASEKELPDVIDLPLFVSVNRVLAGESYILRIGQCRNRPRLSMHGFLLEMMDKIVSFHTSEDDYSRQCVLPFNTLEHFVAVKYDVNVAMEQYHAWYSTFRTFHDLLLALSKPFKIVIWLANWVAMPPSIDELKAHMYSNADGISYQDPKSDVSDKQKQVSDTVGINTITDDDVGDIITVISWYKGTQEQGKEIIYHVSPEAHKSIDSLQNILINNGLGVERREHFFDEMEDLKSLYSMNKKLDLH